MGLFNPKVSLREDIKKLIDSDRSELSTKQRLIRGKHLATIKKDTKEVKKILRQEENRKQKLKFALALNKKEI
jgi:hypothetical protein